MPSVKAREAADTIFMPGLHLVYTHRRKVE